MLLNIAPMADGTIPSGQQTILLGIGDWLGRFGEAIYATRAWPVYGEGPTQMGGGAFTGPTGRHAAGHPVHPQPGQHGAVRHRLWAGRAAP